MAWADTVVAVLKKYNVRYLNYLPDSKIEKLLEAARNLDGFEALPLTREEEGIGMVCGLSLGGARGNASDCGGRRVRAMQAGLFKPRQYLSPHHADGRERLLLPHPQPLHAHDDRLHTQCLVAADLPLALIGVANDEAVLQDLLKGHIKAVRRRQVAAVPQRRAIGV